MIISSKCPSCLTAFTLCGKCGRPVTGESDKFCPHCGERYSKNDKGSISIEDELESYKRIINRLEHKLARSMTITPAQVEGWILELKRTYLHQGEKAKKGGLD